MKNLAVWGAAVAGVVLALAASSSARSQTPVERGNYLVNAIMACGNCHTPKGPDGLPVAGKELSGGGVVFVTPGFTVAGANITPDRETGIGAWSDDDIKRALTEGIRPAQARLPGVKLAAAMPIAQYRALTPRDLDAVVAYLRTVPAIRNEVQAPIYKRDPVYAPYPGAEKPYSDDALRDEVTRGQYLATIGHCMTCHTTMAGGVLDYANGFGKGGRVFGPATDRGFPDSWTGSTAKNITSDKDAGIGSWSDAEIKRAITQGVDRDGHALSFPMGFFWYRRVTDQDVNAIVAWLRTLPPLK
jgi:mono/diheme cytochrome c family protein